MFDFIRKNKVFVASLTFCICIILFLSTCLVLKKTNGEDNILVLPPILNPVEDKDPEISLFKGDFNDENNTVFLTWDYQLNSHTFQKVELYRNDFLIQTYYDERQCEISIFEYAITTGYNNFEVILYYDNGMAVTKEANVFVDYVFDIETSHQLVDNNLGKGYLVTIEYVYNTKTPAGFPELNIETNYSSHGYWKFKQIDAHSKAMENNYQKIKVYYLVNIDKRVDDEISWEFNFKFTSVGARHELEFVENPSLIEVNREEILIKK